MTKKTIFILITSILFITLAVFTLNKKDGGSIYNDFLISDTSTVEKIFMVNKNNEQVTLIKENQIWKVNGKDEAIGENVKILLSTLMHIDIRNPISKAAYNTMVKQLATNSVKVEIYQNDPLFRILGLKFFVKTRKTKEFYVGSPTRDYKGTVMKMSDSDDIYVTYLPGFNGYLSERFSSNYSDWVNHQIFKIPIRSIVKVRVEFGEEPNQSYEISNDGNKSFSIYSLYNESKISNYDTIRLLNTLSAFRNINFETLLDNIPQERKDSLSKLNPYRTVSVTTVDQKTTTLKMYLRPNYSNNLDLGGNLFEFDMDRMYAFIDDFEHPVTVQFFVVDNISRPLSYLLGMPLKPSNYNTLPIYK